jgi:hypothetical protein
MEECGGFQKLADALEAKADWVIPRLSFYMEITLCFAFPPRFR